MNPLTGTWKLTRLALHRDRLTLPAWFLGLAGFTAATTALIVDDFSDQPASALVKEVEFSAGSPAIRLLGLASGASTGSYTLVRDYVTLAVLSAVMSSLAMVRHTRQNEETGRSELLGAATVGRHASLAAATIVTVGANLALALLVTLAMIVNAQPVAGSVIAGAAVGAVGIAFAGIAANAAQLASSTRGANGLSAAVLAAAFLAAGVGNATGHLDASGLRVISAWPAWLSPIGWGQQARPFDGGNWWPLLLCILLFLFSLATATTIAARRDQGSGLLPQRPGPEHAPRTLRSAFGLAVRLQRGALIGWGIGMLGFGLIWGAVIKQQTTLSESSAEWYNRIGGTDHVLDGYRASIMAMAGMATAVYVVQMLLRMRAEEASGLLDHLLVRAVSRPRWVASHLLSASLGALGLLLVFATGMGVAAGAALHDVTGQLRDLTGAGLAQLPSTLVLGGVVIAAVGLLPRFATALSWTLLMAAMALGPIFDLGLPQQLRDLSPFTHAPMLPAAQVTAVPMLSLATVFAVFTIAGLVAVRQRDLVPQR